MKKLLRKGGYLMITIAIGIFAVMCGLIFGFIGSVLIFKIAPICIPKLINLAVTGIALTVVTAFLAYCFDQLKQLDAEIDRLDKVIAG